MISPDNFDQVRHEVEDAIAQELPRCGSQAEIVRREADQTIEQARLRAQSILEQQRREEERRQEEERIRKELEEKTWGLLATLGGMVSNAQQECEKLREAAAPAAGEQELSLKEVKALSKAVGDASTAAKTACMACTDFIVSNRSSMEQAKSMQVEMRNELLKYQGLLHECFKLIAANLNVKAVQDKAIRKAVAGKRREKRQTLFEKYDADKDGVLNQAEVQAYSTGEFKFTVPDEALAKMLKNLTKGGSGIPKENFQRLKMAIGVAREEEASRVRRKEAEERRKRIEAHKSQLISEFASTQQALDAAEPEVVAAEGKAKPCGASDNSTPQAELSVLVEEAYKPLDDAKKTVSILREKILGFRNDVEEELTNFVQLETQKMEIKANSYDLRIQAAGNLIQKARDILHVQKIAALDKLRTEIAAIMKTYVKDKGITLEEFFTLVDADKDGAISRADFVGFLGKLETCDTATDKLEELFDHIDVEGSSVLPKDLFLRLSRVYYYVVKETVMTTMMAIKEGKTIRRMELEEVIEVEEGPFVDETVGVTRVKGSAVKDGAQGWVTVIGNSGHNSSGSGPKGSVFLVEGGGSYSVEKAIPMTSSFEAKGQEPIRTMAVGDKVDVIEWDRKDETGTVRLKVRLQGGGAVGWIPKSNEKEGAFLTLIKS